MSQPVESQIDVALLDLNLGAESGWDTFHRRSCVVGKAPPHAGASSKVTDAVFCGGSGLWGYNIYRNGGFLKQVMAPATSTSDAGLLASTTYSYTILAFDNATPVNISAQSAPVTRKTPSCGGGLPPSVPTGLSVTAASCNQINLSWNASIDTGGSGLKGYNVYRNGAFLKQVLAPATSTTDTGLNASSAYSYSVSAVDNANNQSAPTDDMSPVTPTSDSGLSIPAVKGILERNLPSRKSVSGRDSKIELERKGASENLLAEAPRRQKNTMTTSKVLWLGMPSATARRHG